KRDRVTREDVTRRIAQQWPDEEKVPLASFVIGNDDRSPVLIQIEHVIRELEAYSTSS
ncbi:MAG: Dephospho-CoA kinase, partial [Bacteroidota bacterium]